MAHVVFTANLQRHLTAGPQEVPGATVRAALDTVFATQPRLRGYILDDQARLRHHVGIFVDGQTVWDRNGLSDALRSDSQLHVMQALSGER